MQDPNSIVSKSGPRRAKLNSSSRTKTSRADRKKDKKTTSVKETQAKIETMIESDELLLPKLFDDASIDSILQKDQSGTTRRRQRVYTVPTTLSLFMQQVLTKDRGCSEVVTMFNKKRKEQQLREVSTNTASYCAARLRIPLSLLDTLVDQTAQLASENLGKDQLWCGRRVFLVDGFVVNAPDTPENQNVYPQPNSQKPGMGFPQIRACASICLATGVVNKLQYGPVEGKKTGEKTLFRQMFPGFKFGDIVVGDANFECFRDLANLKAKGVDMVCDKNGSRESPFKGKCKVIEETIKQLPRPAFNKSRFTLEEWEALPASLSVRIIRCKVGGRKSELTLVTSLLDCQRYPAKKIVQLYKLRWECELDIRNVKSVMGMTWLSCHTPQMLQRELMVYILAYNIIRITMCDAAKVSGQLPRDLSFKNAKDSWLQFGQDQFQTNDCAWLLWSISHAPLRKRPGRKEPRKIKRRSSKYEKTKLPRALEKAALAP